MNTGRFARFSTTHSRANCPDWISLRDVAALFGQTDRISLELFGEDSPFLPLRLLFRHRTLLLSDGFDGTVLLISLYFISGEVQLARSRRWTFSDRVVTYVE